MAYSYMDRRRHTIPNRVLKLLLKYELSSPYNPESNGLAEAAVKNIKSIITRCNKEGENLKLAIAAWRNMARTDGISPSQLFYRRRQRQLLPLMGEQAKS